MKHYRCQQLRYRSSSYLISIITILCLIVALGLDSNFVEADLVVGSLTDENLKFGSFIQDSSPISELTSITVTHTTGPRVKTTRLSSVGARRDQQQDHPLSTTINRDHQSQQSNSRVKPDSNKHREEILSTDCLTKRNEILSRQAHGHNQQQQQPSSSPNNLHLPATNNNGFQRLRPKYESPVTTSHLLATSPSTQPPNETHLGAHNLDIEHVPKCNQNGGYEPIQCHKIGYCWCVNKYGQAIKNTAILAGEEPFCDPNMYESESNDWVVVAGVSARRLDNFLKNVSSFDSSTPNGHLNFEAPEGTTEQFDSSNDSSSQSSSGNNSDQGSKPSSKSRGPIMPLIPNDCKSSRSNARERANKYMNDSIWIPDCDLHNEQLYAEKQCHRSKVCWCVDQSTGLPLRTSDQLTARSSTSNCTELKRLIELSASPKPQSAFYLSSSEHCDRDKRADFIINLSSQFRQQIGEYVRQNPSSLSNLPQGISSTNPYAISGAQVSRWKFTLMDRDSDGRLGDREWSKFKNNFKLVDRVDELDNPFKQQKSPYFALTPLLILRTQRKCWRDFLDFCGGGDLLIDESISLSKWLSCTEVPPSSVPNESVGEHHYHPLNYVRGGVPSSMENTYAHSREAAITRSKKKNPFLQILKPD